MKSLTFAASGAAVCAGKRIRASRFQRRSSLPASAACVVANGVRETLSALLGTAAAVRLFEPVIPDADAWKAVVDSAMLYRVRGNVSDAAVILRRSDATALAGALFGEAPDLDKGRALSPIECTILERTANAIATNFGAVCGSREAYPVERVSTIAGFVSFFELLVEKPVVARIGIAISRDPAPESRGSLEVAQLANVRIAAVGSLHLGKLPASRVAALSVGMVLPVPAASLSRCILAAGGRRFAYGACGVRNGRYAIATRDGESG